MLVKNMDQSNGLVNGSRGIIVGFTKDSQKFPICKYDKSKFCCFEILSKLDMLILFV